MSCWLITSLSQAQCTKDTDCKGERVCEEGACVAAPTSSAPPPAEAPAPAPAAAPPPPPPPPPSYAEPPDTSVRDTRVKDLRGKRHSTGMMAGGIVMVSFVPIALLAAWVADIEQNTCERGYDFYSGSNTNHTDCGRYDPTIYGGLISAAVLAGVGIPLIIIGGKREPVGTAKITPWATPQAGGVSLRVDL